MGRHIRGTSAVKRKFHKATKSRGRKVRRRPAAPPAANAGGDPLDAIGSVQSFATNAKIFRKGEPDDCLFKVEAGCVRTYSDFADGCRRIHAFYLPDEYFGLERGEVHDISAEAVTASRVRVIEKQALIARAAGDAALVKRLIDIAARELQRAQNHNLLLLKGAQDRLVDFLRDMRQRMRNGSEVDLPMPRRDIADHLGLTIETLSRALTRLRNTSAILLLSSRRVVLRDVADEPKT
jgi:CRP/FNR family transcriptional regulator, nitrogen fixation regulation protein